MHLFICLNVENLSIYIFLLYLLFNPKLDGGWGWG